MGEEGYNIRIISFSNKVINIIDKTAYLKAMMIADMFNKCSLAAAQTVEDDEDLQGDQHAAYKASGLRTILKPAYEELAALIGDDGYLGQKLTADDLRQLSIDVTPERYEISVSVRVAFPPTEGSNTYYLKNGKIVFNFFHPAMKHISIKRVNEGNVFDCVNPVGNEDAVKQYMDPLW